MTISQLQNRGPAGHEHVFKYRFACSQLKSRVNANSKTEWYVTKADGSDYVLHTMAPQPNATLWLDTAGICKTGGEIVPVVSPQEAAAAQPQRLELTPHYIPQTQAPMALTLGAVALGGVGIMIYFRRQIMEFSGVSND